MSKSLPPNDRRPDDLPGAAPAEGADFDAYLDGLVPEDQQADWTRRLERDPSLQCDAALQRRVDETLRAKFPAAAPSPEHLAQVARLQHAAAGGPAPRRYRRGALLAAAVLVVAVGMALLAGDRTVPHQTPFFEPTPLAEVYRTAVASGFQPYYECREPERLTAIFLQRLATRLHLLPMPPGSRMLGLSYPGGLSRDTTAMLCRVDGAPVLVAVDRRQADRKQPAPGVYEGQPLHLHRAERDGLVFYEISPFAQPRAMQYLVPTTDDAPDNF